MHASFLVFTALNGLVAGSAFLWARSLSADFKTLDRILAAWVFFLAQVILAEVMLGVPGLLSLEALVAFHGLVLAATCLYLTVARGRRPPSRLSLASCLAALSRTSHGFAGFALLGLAYLLSIFLVFSLNSPPTDFDALAYHLPFAVTWMQQQQLVLPNLAWAEIANNYFPGNLELLLLWVMYPLGNDLFVKLATFSFVILAALGLYGACRQCRATRDWSLLAVVLFVASPMVLRLSINTAADLPVAALFLVSLYFLLRFRQSGSNCLLAVGAVASGLMVGCKSTGIVFALGLLPLVAFPSRAMLAAGPGIRRRAIHAIGRLGLFFLLVMLLGSYWYLRNLVLTGTPLYPAAVRLLGITVFDGPVDINDYYGSYILAKHFGEHAGLFFEALTRELGMQWLVLLLASLAAPLLFWRKLWAPWGCDEKAVRVYLFLLIVPMWLVYAHTPYSLQVFSSDDLVKVEHLSAGLRFATPAVALSFIALAALASSIPRPQQLLQSVAILLLLQNLMVYLDLAASHLWSPYPAVKPTVFVGAVVVVVSILLGGIYSWLKLGTRIWTRYAIRIKGQLSPLGRGVAKSLVIVTVACVVWFGVTAGIQALMHYRESLRFEYYRYAQGEALGDAWEWMERNSSGHRIAYAGNLRIYPLCGSRLGNSVLYINRDGCDHCKAHDYFWPKSIEDADAWRQSLARQHIDYLFIAGVAPWERTQVRSSDAPGFLSLVFCNGPVEIYRHSRHGPKFWVDANFGDLFRLVGYDLSEEVKAGSTLEIILYWRRMADTSDQYSVFSHLVDSEWMMWAQNDGVPQVDGSRFASWGSGEIIEDHRAMAIPPEMPAGEYRMEIGVYSPLTMERLTIGNAAEDDLTDRVLTQVIRVER